MVCMGTDHDNVKWIPPIHPYVLGFWLAEGCKSISGAKKYPAKYVHFDNTNQNLLHKIRILVGCVATPYHVSGNCFRLSVASAELYDTLPKARSWEKRIPRWFMENASTDQLRELMTGMMDGDGCYQDASSHYDTCSFGLASDFQELLIRTGSYGTLRQIGVPGTKGIRGTTSKHNQYRVIINQYPHRVLNGYNLVQTPYAGKVYCVEVPNHIIMVRRKGNTMWCGNSMDDTRYFVLAKINSENGVFIGTSTHDVTPS